MSHETRTSPPTYPEILDIHDGAFSESIWGSDGFRTIKVSGQSDVIADSYKDNLTITAGENVTLTTNASGDTLTISATPGVIYTAGTGISISSNEISVTSVALTTVQTAANQTAHLALTAQEGDVVVRSDENKSYVKNAGTAGSMSDWTLLATPTDLVLSVAGYTGAVTAANIKTAYESNSQTNAFTDADHSKLDGIENSATADQTDAEIRTAVGDAADSNIFTDVLKSKLDAIEPSATADQTSEEIEDIVGGMVSGNTETGITVTYEDSDGTLDFVVASQTDQNFTNADHTKLDGIEASADVTDATNVDAAGAVMNADVDAKGDILAASADNTVTRLAVGSNDHVLTADSSTGTGLKWSAIPSSGDVNQNAFSTVAVSGQDNVAADTTTDTLNLAAGSNVTLTTNATSDTVTIAASNTDSTKMPLAGGTFTDNVNFADTKQLQLGNGADMKIYHDSGVLNTNFITNTKNLDIRAKDENGGLVTISDSLGENLIKCTAGSSVVLTYDGTPRITTTTAGATVAGTISASGFSGNGNSLESLDASELTGDIAQARMGTGSASGTVFLAGDRTWKAVPVTALSATGTASSSTFLRGDNTWQTVSTGGLGNIVEDTSPQLGGDLDTNSFEISLDDSHKVKFGTDNDFGIYHDGSHAYMDNSTGDILLRVGGSGTTNGLYIENSGPTFLYHSGTYKAKTDGGGFIVSGTCTATTFSGDLNGTINTSTTATTQSASNNSTKVATTAYVETAVAAVVDSSPSALNTLNELAAALGDDANYATTTATSIGTKLPKAGGEMTGNITFSGSQTVDGRDLSADGSKLDGIASSANNYTHPNHSGEVTSSADGATTIASNVVDEDNLKVSNSPTNGYALTAQSGNTGGLTWAAMSGGGASTGEKYVYYKTGATLANDGSNTYAGYEAGNALNGSSSENTLYGYRAGKGIQAGARNVAIGLEALESNCGNDNTAIGKNALQNFTGSENVAVGHMALKTNVSGRNNVALGYEAGKSVDDGDYNVFIGHEAGKLAEGGDSNVIIGQGAADSLVDGDENVIIGKGAAGGLVDAGSAVFIGKDSGVAASGAGNTCVGHDSGKFASGTNNTCIGKGAGDIGSFSGGNNLIIGYGADPSAADVDNEITLGDSSITKFRIPGLNFSLKDTTATDNYVLTVDSNGDCGWEAAAGGTDSTKLPLTGGTLTGDVIFDNATNAGKDLTWDMSDNALEFKDGVKASFGDSDDLTIEHSGGNNVIYASPGKLIIKADANIEFNAGNNESMIEAIVDGSVRLFHNGNERVKTTAFGTEFTGDLIIPDVIEHLGDSDTRIRFSSSDRVDIETGGSRRFRADSSGIEVTGTVTASSTAVGTAGLRKVHASTSAPGGGDGANGDLWIKY